MYPESLFVFLAESCVERDLAWDCGTGNGQAARSVATHFKSVIATDASAEQIDSADHQDGIEFRVAPAETSGLPAGSVDLITVAQALHWFDIERFFDEAQRVLKPGGVLSYWCYERCKVDPQCDDLVEQIFAEVEPYWPPERDIVENHYAGFDMPFPSIPVGDFAMHASWSADNMLAYMRTWSASQRYMKDRGRDPVARHADDLAAAWGSEHRQVRWPITLKAGQKAPA